MHYSTYIARPTRQLILIVTTQALQRALTSLSLEGFPRRPLQMLLGTFDRYIYSLGSHPYYIYLEDGLFYMGC